MPVKIRLMRIGAKKRPFYRVVAVDERNKRTGAYLELLGTYNPLTEPKEIKLKQDLIDAWLKKGAQPSDGFLRIIGKAPQKPPRKPKKDQGKEPEAPAPTPKAAEDLSNETPNDEIVDQQPQPNPSDTAETAQEEVTEESNIPDTTERTGEEGAESVKE